MNPEHLENGSNANIESKKYTYVNLSLLNI